MFLVYIVVALFGLLFGALCLLGSKSEV